MENKIRRKTLIGVVFIAFLVSIVTYFLLINFERKALAEYEREQVWVAKKELVKGQEIQLNLLSELFEVIEIEKSILPKGNINNIEELEGMRTVISLTEGMILTDAMFTNEKEKIDKMNKPVLIGCKAEDLFQFVSGTLRSGDLIHIYTVNSENEAVAFIWENILVYQVFDQSGNRILSSDTETAALRINILLEEEDVETFYKELMKGSLRVVKVW